MNSFPNHLGNGLRVKPVRRYRAARYPSHLDPDPTMFPVRIPYPASKKLLAAVASAGIAASVSCSNESVSSAPIDPNAKNPFTATVSGLPHRTSAYGTGVPDYIDADLARRVIERTFRQQGYDLSSDHRIDEKEIACPIDGYDAKRKIGYVFAGYSNLENDVLVRWWATQAKSGDTDSAISTMIQSARFGPDQQKLSAEVKAARALPDPARREAALQVILEKYSSERLSRAEIEKLRVRAPRTKQFIAVISQFDRRFASQPVRIDRKQLDAIKNISDPAKRAAAMRELEEKASRVAIERLEKSVREYISWARSQGG